MNPAPWVPAALLIVGALGGLLWANLAGESYHELWHHHVAVGAGPLAIDLSLHHWVNDALMVLFFLGAGVEIKRELVRGELRSPRAAALPALGALGGMLAPIGIYLLCARDAPQGWAVPVATDAAFALGVLALAGRGVPVHVKLFLLTLAIADDVGGILIIATVFTEGLAWGWLLAAVGCVLVIFAMRAAHVDHPLAYVPVCALMWLFTLRSGVHATIAGVVAGVLVPGVPMNGVDVIDRVDRGLRPLVTFVVFPLFALANTGIHLDGAIAAEAAASPVFWGVALGLVVGKAVGITAFTLGALRLGIGALPQGMGRRHVPAVGLLGGIGFTVAIFVADLSFEDPHRLGQAKLAILGASVAASAAGLVVLRGAGRASAASK